MTVRANPEVAIAAKGVLLSLASVNAAMTIRSLLDIDPRTSAGIDGRPEAPAAAPNDPIGDCTLDERILAELGARSVVDALQTARPPSLAIFLT